MPEKDAKVSDNNSSSHSDQDEGLNPTVDESSQEVDNSIAESSNAETSDNLDTQSIVQDVVDSRDEKPEEAASQAEGEVKDGETDKSPETDEDDEGKKDPEDYSDVPFHKHPRFQQLLSEKKELSIDAQRYRNVQSYMDDNGLSAEETADGLLVMGLMKTDPAEAWKRLKPVVHNLLVATGEILPEDLKQQVAAGELDPKSATEISRSRAKADNLQASQNFREQQRTQHERQNQAHSLQSAANDWETARKGRDPNYATKLPLLRKEVAWLQHSEGVPRTPDGVRDQLKRAYDSIVLPTAAPATPTRVSGSRLPASTGGQGSNNANPDPSSTMDIIDQEMARR